MVIKLEVIINPCENPRNVRDSPHVTWTEEILDGDFIKIKFQGLEVDSHHLSSGDTFYSSKYQVVWSLISETQETVVTAEIIRSRENKKFTYGEGEFKLNLNWMYGLRNVIGDREFRDLVIPATHNSCALQGTGFLESMISSRYVCQAVPAFQQGVLGNRFWDLRIKRSSEGVYHIVHGKVTLQKVEFVFAELKRLIEASKDVFFVDVHELNNGFSGFEDYHDFFEFIESFFRDQLACPKSIRTFNAAVTANRRLILSLSDKKIFKHKIEVPSWNYSRIKHFWADKVEFSEIADHMFSYLRMNIHSRDLKVMCMQSTKGIFQGSFTGLDQFALINSTMIVKFIDSIQNLNPNIIMVDFLECSKLVEKVIELNKKKYQANENSLDTNCCIM